MSSSSSKEKTLLGKKHKKKEEKEENSSINNKEEEESDSEKSNSSSSQDDDKPVKSIFGNNTEKETGFKTGGLFGKSPNFSSEKGGAFGDLSNPIKNPVSLFGSSNDNIIKKDSSLFGSGLFVFNSNDNKDEKKDSKSEKDEEEEVILAVAHKEFLSLDVRSLVRDGGVVYDVKGVLDRKMVDARL